MVKKEQIYAAMLGMYSMSTFQTLKIDGVRNEFAPGRRGDELVDIIYRARVRLGDRLGTDDEDDDVIDIVRAYEAMLWFVSMKMYDYGKKFG